MDNKKYRNNNNSNVQKSKKQNIGNHQILKLLKLQQKLIKHCKINFRNLGANIKTI